MGELEGLGAVVERFATESRRHGLRAAAFLAVGILLLAPGLALLIAVNNPTGRRSSQASDPFLAPLLMIIFGAGFLMFAAVHAWLFLPRNTVSFVLHKGGVVHERAGQARVIPWDEITKVELGGNNTVWARFVAGGVRHRFRLSSGEWVVVRPLTSNSETLARAIARAVKDGVRPSVRRTDPRRR